MSNSERVLRRSGRDYRSDGRRLYTNGFALRLSGAEGRMMKIVAGARKSQACWFPVTWGSVAAACVVCAYRARAFLMVMLAGRVFSSIITV